MSPLLSWKFAVQGLAACGAVGLTALTMFGADSAPKPRAIHTATPSHHRRAPKVAPTTPSTDPPAEVLGSDTSQASGSPNSLSSSAGDGASGSTAAGDQPAADPGPPPTVPETEFPVALPISAVVIVGLGAGGVAVARRRRSRDGSGS